MSFLDLYKDEDQQKQNQENQEDIIQQGNMGGTAQREDSGEMDQHNDTSMDDMDENSGINAS